MMRTTSVIEIEPSGDVSYLGVQPFRVHDFISQWLHVFDSIMLVSIFHLEQCLFITSIRTLSLESLRAFFTFLLSSFPVLISV